jgi:amino acid adenylation domain-containing protein
MGGPRTLFGLNNLDRTSQLCVHQVFERQVARLPDAIAIRCEGETLTYAQLNARANQIAHCLQEHGVKPDTLVALCVERSLNAVAALLGILKSGGAYVPLDPAFPKQRLEQILEDSQPEVMITEQALQPKLSSFAKHTLLTDSPALAGFSMEDPEIGVDPHNLAYVIFTSGSTGRPKGVQVEHRALMNFLMSMSREPGLTRNDVLIAVTTLSFDIAALEIFLPLIIGAQVVLARNDVVLDGSALRRLLETTQATVMQATPVTWWMILESGWQGCEQLKILCGGETMPADLARELIPRCASLWNLYGPTETTVWSTLFPVVSAEPRIPIGRPIANTEIFIVDHQLRQVPNGDIGELLIGGLGLARGYLNDLELTAEHFIQNPFPGAESARLYRTGDLCRVRSDGAIEYLGRTDTQVKVRGHRIELGDIEAALQSHPAIKQAAAMVAPGPRGEKNIIGYVVTAGVQIQELRDFLAERLPDYMLPSTYVRLDQLPLTPNRKLDRNALPVPDEWNVMAEGSYVSPQPGLQSKLAEIVARLLALERVGAHDNFFLIGGHSLFCTQLVARIQSHFGVELAVRDVFESPTPAELAQQLERKIPESVP